VVNILPLTAETRHLMGRDQFAPMKPTGVSLNVGRGATTDEAALVRVDLDAGY
jgi:lactate dehydrogenase-like 2-hydroxyacid dehydrogenase